jgi:rSAM/selenodomain-associated transferase 1
MESTNQNTVRFSNQQRTLVIMAKAPRPGMVKTRLSQSLASVAVAALSRCFLEDTITLAKSLNGVEVAIMCPSTDAGELERLLGNTVEIVAQKGEGLAAGLTSVFSHFAASSQRHVIAFNSDSPHLPVTFLEGAFQALAVRDLVVGPTHDGGYYLVGARAAHATLFENDGLGTKSALERLLARARALELSTGLAEPFYDIDVADDLIRLAHELRLAPAKAPRTSAWLAEWGETVPGLAPRVGEL